MNGFKALGSIATGFAIGCFMGCNKGDVAGTSTETVTGKSTGLIFLADGKPAAGARVRVYPVDHRPMEGSGAPPAFQTHTDKTGRYYLDSVSSDKYNILSDLDGFSAVQDSVQLSLTPVTLESDTLRKPGTICGYVSLQPGDLPATAVVQLLGTFAFANVDSRGFFELPAMAPGRYRAAVSTTLPDYTVLHVGLIVPVGGKDTLGDTLRPQFTGIPRVAGLNATIDTLNQVVRLSWPAVRFPNQDRYLIYRDSSGILVRSTVHIAATADTVFIDSFPVNAGSDSTFSVRSFEYRVVASDFSQKPGKIVEIKRVELPSRAFASTLIRMKVLNPSSGSIFTGDSLAIAADYASSTRELSKISWFVDGPGISLRQGTPPRKSGADTLKLTAPASPTEMLIRVEVTDNAGMKWGKDLRLDILGRTRLAVDTLKQQVRISWPAVHAGGFRQYLIYREPKGTSFGSAVPIARSADTAYTDNLLETDLETNENSTLIREFEYRIAYLDDAGRISHPIATASASLPAAVFVKTFATLKASGTDRGEASFNDSIEYVLDFRNRTRGIENLTWHLNAPNGAIRSDSPKARQGQNHFRIAAPASAGSFEVAATLTDEAGGIWTFKEQLRVVSDPPKVDLGKYRFAIVGEQMSLYSGSSERFGKIVKWEWDIGAKGSFVTGSGNDTSFMAPSTPDTNFLCVVRATDDDGETGLDTVRIGVLPWKRGRTVPQWKIDDCAAGYGGKAFLFGGKVLNGSQSTMTAKAHAYDPDNDTWEELPQMDLARSECRAGSTDSAILVFGGKGPVGFSEGVTDAVSQYNPLTRAWTRKTSMPHPRAGFHIVHTGGKFYLFGGTRTQGPLLDTMDVYDPALDQWQSLPAFPGYWSGHYASATGIGSQAYILSNIASMSYFFEGYDVSDFSRKSYPEITITDTSGTGQDPAPQLVPVGGRVFVVGGQMAPYTGGILYPKRVPVFNPSSGKWSDWFPLPEGRNPDCVVSSQGRIFVIGGWGNNGKSREIIEWAEVGN
jgi:hypothetical protein